MADPSQWRLAPRCRRFFRGRGVQLGASLPSKPLEPPFFFAAMTLDHSEPHFADVRLTEDDGAQEFWAALARQTEEDVNSGSSADASLVEEAGLELSGGWRAPRADELLAAETQSAASHDRRTAACPRLDQQGFADRARSGAPIPRRPPTRRSARRFATRLPTSGGAPARRVADCDRGVSLPGAAATGGLLGALAVALVVVFTPLQRSPSRPEAAAPPIGASALSRDKRDRAGRGRAPRAERRRAAKQRSEPRPVEARTARLPVSAPSAPAPASPAGSAPKGPPAAAPSSTCCPSSSPSSQGGSDGGDVGVGQGGGGRGEGGGAQDGGNEGGAGGQEFGFER